MTDLLIRRISEDLGIIPYQGESEVSFASRALYSAARFQIESYCFDDGQGGSQGLLKQEIAYRFNEWIKTLGRIYPWCPDWFQIENSGVDVICNRLIEIGDLAPVSEEGRLRVSAARLLPLMEGLSLRLGFYDASSEPEGLINGLATLVEGPTEAVHFQVMNPRWWEKGAPYLDWQEASAFESLRFARRKVSWRSVWDAGAWCDELPRDASLWIAKQSADSGGKGDYYAVEVRNGKLFAAKIDWHLAETFFLHLRAQMGNSVVAVARKLDEHHYELHAPLHLIAPEGSRWIEAMSWPDEIVGVHDRIIRAETLNAVRRILNECDVALKEK